MNLVKTYRSYRRLMKSQWLSSRELKQIQRRALTRLTARAFENVPYYRGFFHRTHGASQTICSLGDLKTIPVTAKRDLLSMSMESRMDRTSCMKELVAEQTSGSTGSPFTVLFDREYITGRNARFLRALETAGYRFGQRLLLITSAKKRTSSQRFLGWRYVSIEEPVESLIAHLNDFRPQVLYGCTTPLRQVAAFIRRKGPKVHLPGLVISTAEMLDMPTRKYLEETLNAELFDFYGMTEMGLVGWECSQHNGYHLGAESVVTEYEPMVNGGAFKLVMTNLELTSMPFIRYETGDMGIPGGPEPCRCGRSLPLLKCVEGRVLDCVRLKDGRVISPYQITCRLEKLKGIQRYQVIQNDYNDFTVKIEPRRPATQVSERGIHNVLTGILGDAVKVEIEQDGQIGASPGRKFRVVESKLCEEFWH